MSSPIDLAPLFSPDSGMPKLGFRQGVVVAWNQSTAENTINVAGTELYNVPILNTFDALSLDGGDVVGLFTFGTSWFIIGRIIVPDSATAGANALSDRTVSATVGAAEATASTTFTDLATPGPSVQLTVPVSARILVFVTAQISGTNFGGDMSFDVVGPAGTTTVAAATTRALRFQAPGAGLVAATFTARVTADDGLTSGINTINAKYRANSGTATFTSRNLTVATI